MCALRHHVGIRVDWLDTYVEDRIVSWAADPEVRAELYGRQEGDSAVAAAARADIDRLEVQLEEARAAGEDPDADAVFWDRRARALAAKLKQARELAYPASLSQGLRQLLGPDAAAVADNWWRLRTQNLPAAKRLIKEIADIRVHKGVHGGDRRHARMIRAGSPGHGSPGPATTSACSARPSSARCPARRRRSAPTRTRRTGP